MSIKYLSHYVQEAQTSVFNEYGAFFAFSNDQFNEKKQDGVKYASLGYGLIAPKDNAEHLMTALDKIHEAGIAADLAENGVKAIIWRELANHECQITCDYSEVVLIMADYGISKEQVDAEWPGFFNDCIDNDYF